MAEKDVLSQEEIDALLESVDESGEADGTGTHADDKKSGAKAKAEGVEAINFTAQERIVKGHLPVLDKIHDRAVKLFAADIYHLTARDFEIKQDPLVVIKHRDFMSGLPNPSLMSIYKLKPLRGKCILLFDHVFVYDVVDYYFGGSTQFFSQKDKQDFTATELRVMDVLTKKLVVDLIQAWEPVINIDVLKVGIETNPQLVNLTEPEEMLLVARFSIDFGKETGSFHFIFPYSMMEPIKQQLELGASRPDDEIDPNWINSLREEIMEVELTVTASMSDAVSSFGKVIAWQVGDFVPLEMNEVVVLDIEGTPSFSGTMGTANDKRALKIIKKISY
ncbi:MAG: flagellar motor switch protein FliM [Legionella sp.]|nr:MAG: flagellar motor switch protein FliM [Legionella sp.]